MKKIIQILIVIILISVGNLSFADIEDDIKFFKEGETHLIDFNIDNYMYNKLDDKAKRMLIINDVIVPQYNLLKSDYNIKVSYEGNIYSVYLTKKELSIEDILSKHTEEINKNYEFYRSVTSKSEKDFLKAYSTGLLEDTYEISNFNYFKGEKIPILMYHELNNLPKDGPGGLYVSKESFVGQLDYLKDNGYNTISMEQLSNYREFDFKLPEKPVVLTFDDGYKSHLWAARELNKRGMTGTFYIITGDDFFNNDWYVSKEEVKEMYNLGMEIGSHTVTHVDARYTSNKKLKEEYVNSKNILENLLDEEITHFCFPIGGTTEYAKEILKDLEMKTSVLTRPGLSSLKQDKYGLKRQRVFYNYSINSFKRLLGGKK